VEENLRLRVSSSPHVSSPETVRSVMLDVIIAMLPILVAATAIFGLRALIVTLFSVISCVLVELAVVKSFGMENRTSDLSAVVTGMLLAFVLPPGVPLWVVFVGALVSIVIAKMVFGGVGNNLFNPALVGRAFLLASWPPAITTWTLPALLGANKFALGGDYVSDAVTGATPLALVKQSGFIYDLGKLFGNLPAARGFSMESLFWGNVGGCIGETSVIAILIGAAYLFYKKHISWHIPFSYIFTVFALTFLYNGSGKFDIMASFLHILAGGLMLGAFFMATDMVTSPITPKGKILFGIGAGMIVYMIRLFGAYPEGVCYSILIMNAFTPLLDRWTRPRVFGEGAKA